ncbi:hypothetical protein [Guptibacillus algicola]|uniref:hypothetical protein n=1 Tax=Guptibacillus algicola TaxID=225844 RepID=UPI001CD3ECB4|nr:hypothetical protein [Alkalihalobacillus algicola]MCA0987424.1 hypothetical protein [Alkalihalobacillus algicola]
MMKVWLSLLAGLICGITLSYFLLDYNSWALHLTGVNGEVIRTTNELDFNFITNVFLLVASASILIYGAWTLIEKKTEER